MLNESLNQFKFDSRRFQQAYNIFVLFQQCWTTCSKAPDIWFNKVLNACWSKCRNRLNQWAFSELTRNNRVWLKLHFRRNYIWQKTINSEY